MIHEIIPVGWLQCNCSIYGDPESGEAIVIDPGDEIERIVAVLNKHRLKVKLIAVTHAHIDHIGGAKKLKDATGAPVYMNDEDIWLAETVPQQAAWIGLPKAPEIAKIDAPLREGDVLQVGGTAGRVLHTPGHTQGSVCLHFEGEKKLFAGDTLFQGSIGRTDLPGGDMQAILRSLHGKLMALEDDTVVVPGHGPLTTIGREREHNPFLA